MNAIDKRAALLSWLQRTNRATALSGDNWLPLPLAAEALGISQGSMRRLLDERAEPLRFRRVGHQRGRWQVSLDSVAAYLLVAEEQAETS